MSSDTEPFFWPLTYTFARSSSDDTSICATDADADMPRAYGAAEVAQYALAGFDRRGETCSDRFHGERLTDAGVVCDVCEKPKARR